MDVMRGTSKCPANRDAYTPLTWMDPLVIWWRSPKCSALRFRQSFVGVKVKSIWSWKQRWFIDFGYCLLLNLFITKCSVITRYGSKSLEEQLSGVGRAIQLHYKFMYTYRIMRNDDAVWPIASPLITALDIAIEARSLV